MRRLLILALSLCPPCFAVQEFYSLSRSVRAMGMGGAFYSLSDDESALLYNPAGLGLYPHKGYIFAVKTGLDVSTPPNAYKAVLDSATSTATVGNLSTQTAEFHGSPIRGGGQMVAYHVRKNFGMALVADSKINVYRSGAVGAPTLDVTQITDTALVFGFAHRFGSHLYLGMNGKVLYRSGARNVYNSVAANNSTPFTLLNLESAGSGLGVDSDLGITYQTPRFGPVQHMGFSFVISNLLASSFPWAQSDTGPPGVPLTLTLGMYAKFKMKMLADPLVVRLEGSEYQSGGNPDVHTGARGGSGLKFLRAGIELPFLEWWSLRAGFYHGSWTVGTSLDFASFKLEFASYNEELGGLIGDLPQRRLALQLTFGFPFKGVMP